MHPEPSEPSEREAAVSGFLVQYLLSGELVPGDSMPDPRSVAVELGVNPDAVASALVRLHRAGVIEPGADAGYIILPHGLTRLKQAERQRFLEEQWPDILKQIRVHGFTLDELFDDTDGEAK